MLRFRPHTELIFDPEEEARVLETVRASFSAPRKMIRNSLAAALSISSEASMAALARAVTGSDSPDAWTVQLEPQYAESAP